MSVAITPRISPITAAMTALFRRLRAVTRSAAAGVTIFGASTCVAWSSSCAAPLRSLWIDPSWIWNRSRRDVERLVLARPALILAIDASSTATCEFRRAIFWSA
jgi:hypothetical protein